VRAESKFDTAIQEIDIEKRIMEDPEVKQNFTNGLYLSMASEYIILDGNELGKVNVSLQRSRFYAITIPDNYAERSCFQMKGDLSAIPNSERRCPVDLGRIPGCPMHGACLKQLILATSPSYLAIVPCEDRSEVNIISTIAGFPLHACATLQSAKIEYTEMRTNVMRRLRDDQRPDEESIHMFGMVKYPDLFTRAEDVGMLMAEYKTMILLAWILKRIDIQKLSVMFFTHQDMQNRRVVPSLRLGENIVDLMRKTQSNEIAEIRKRKIFLDDMALHVESIMADTEQKKRYQDALKARYRRMNGDTPDLPPGIQREDAQYLEDYSVKTFGTSLQDTTVVPLGVPSEF
jgi:hypothetical protein